MKLFQKSLTCWFSAGCMLFLPFPAGFAAPEKPKAGQFSAPFDPAKGFKPAQTNLTEIFLQIAGSLEATGSPESYIRHMQAEHKRVAALYLKKTGKKSSSHMPSHLTDEYLERLIKNWNVLASPLGLNDFTKEIGHCAREGIIGTRSTGTMAVDIFNSHQDKVAAGMSGKQPKPAGFEDLRKQLEINLEWNREILDTGGYTAGRRDAVDYASIIDGLFKKQLRKIDGISKPEKAAALKRSLVEWFLDLGYLAESELEIGIVEAALSK